MIHHFSMAAAYKQNWGGEPQNFTTPVKVDIEKDVIMIETPTGATLALDFTALRHLVHRIETQHGQKSNQ